MSDLSDSIILKSGDSVAEISLHGAQVLRFAPDGKTNVLFVSPHAKSGRGMSVRGGVPLCFPNFGPSPATNQHGFARKKDWALRSRSDAAAVLTLSSDAETLEQFPFDFLATLTVVLIGDALQMAFEVENRTKDVDLIFTFCFHNYLAVDSVAAARVSGLTPALLLDKTQGNGTVWDATTEVHFEGEVDRVCLAPRSRSAVLAPGGARRPLRIDFDPDMNCTLWNPGAEKAAQVPDLLSHEGFVCIEPLIYGQPVRLAPQERRIISQKISQL